MLKGVANINAIEKKEKPKHLHTSVILNTLTKDACYINLLYSINTK